MHVRFRCPGADALHHLAGREPGELDSTLLQKARLASGGEGPDPVRLLRVLATSLRAAAAFHDARIAAVLGRAADDMMRRSEEIGAPEDARPRHLSLSWKIARRMLDDASD